MEHIVTIVDNNGTKWYFDLPDRPVIAKEMIKAYIQRTGHAVKSLVRYNICICGDDVMVAGEYLASNRLE